MQHEELMSGLPHVRRPFFNIHTKMLRNLPMPWGVPFFDHTLPKKQQDSQKPFRFKHIKCLWR